MNNFINNLESLGYKDITKESPIHFLECVEDFFECSYPYNKRFYKREGDKSIVLNVGNIYSLILISGIYYYTKGYQKFEVISPSKCIDKIFKETVNAVLYEASKTTVENRKAKL